MNKTGATAETAIPRRGFLKGMLAGAGGIAGGDLWLPRSGAAESGPKPEYQGPNVILVRFGGGVRRRETIDPEHTYAPYLCRELTRRGTLFRNMEIASLDGVETSHGQGTLYIITGRYDRFKDVSGKFLGARFEAKVPTVFEYLRKQFDIPPHQTLIVNGEDRSAEEFYSFSNHHLFGASFRCNVLSLYRFKTYLLRQQIELGEAPEKKLKKMRQDLAKLETVDYRTGGQDRQGPEIEQFWGNWRGFYGDSGLVNPRGDRLLTELTLRAMKELRPKLIMVNYNDPDYVHWGNISHYTRGVSIIDDGIKQLVSAVESDEAYRDNTVFVVVPDCGRDNNPFTAVPCQHHFNTKSAHEIWALIFGPGIAEGVVVDNLVQQTSIAATIGTIMGAKTEFAEEPVLEEAFV